MCSAAIQEERIVAFPRQQWLRERVTLTLLVLLRTLPEFINKDDVGLRRIGLLNGRSFVCFEVV